MTSSDPGARLARAWACLGANALVLPGLGSVAAGLWLSGILQMVGSLVGFVLTMSWAIGWLGSAIADGALPTDLGPRPGRGGLGLLLFALAWVWSVGSGVLLLRRARRLKTPLGGAAKSVIISPHAE